MTLLKEYKNNAVAITCAPFIGDLMIKENVFGVVMGLVWIIFLVLFLEIKQDTPTNPS